MEGYGNSQVLKDLGDLVATTKASVLNFTRPAEFVISSTFAEALVAAFADYSFEFYERTVKVATPAKQYIYVSNQSFALAVCLMDFCEEIGRYRSIAYRILNYHREELADLVHDQGRLDDKIFTKLRDKDSPQVTAIFKEKTKEFFSSDAENEEIAIRNTDFLMRFLTDYTWWLGGKQISRGNDWCISPISALLNMPQNDSNFIARVVSKTTEDAYFRNAFKEAIKFECSQDSGSEDMLSSNIHFQTGYSCEMPRNRILFGAPGTGKSFTLNHEKETLLSDGGEYERVTFHPDYSYANFVGTYKPVPCEDDQGHDAITYAYVPGPFMRTYVKALQNSRTDTPKPFLLVIEEINRANVAAVFGDVFQLLDRGDDEVSEYPIQASEDIKKYLAGKLGGNPDDYSEIRIPDNMFIWATMNSADQGVFPMDTAFKRRWDFTYIGIDDSETGIVGKKVILGQGEYLRVVEWNALRKAINSELLTYKVNEDKLMGPYFISKKNLPEGDIIDPEMFTRIFKNKVLMYLFDDAAKQKRPSLFAGCKDESKNLYSQICKEFDTKGVFIFCSRISDSFLPEGDEE